MEKFFMGHSRVKKGMHLSSTDRATVFLHPTSSLLDQTAWLR